MIRGATTKANCEWYSTSEPAILQELRSTWRTTDKYIKEETAKREQWLQEASDRVAGLSADQEKALNQIRHRERARWRFHCIRATLHRLHAGGLALVDVTILHDDGTIGGWESITDPKRLHDMVIERNINHLQQASPTPFGHGKGYDLLHGPERHTTAEKILNGTLEWKYPMEEVNKWVEQLQRAYKEDKLQQEVDNINCPISED